MFNMRKSWLDKSGVDLFDLREKGNYCCHLPRKLKMGPKLLMS